LMTVGLPRSVKFRRGLLKPSRIHCACIRTKLAHKHLNSADVATASVLLVQRGEDDFDLVPQPAASCKSCGMCGAVAQPPEITAGERAMPVTVSLPMKSLLLLVALLYGVPLVGLLSGALLAAMFGGSDLVAAAAAALCCVAAVRTMKRRAGHFEHRIIQSLSVRCER